MSVLAKLEQRVTGMQRADEWQSAEVRMSTHCGFTGNDRPGRMAGHATQAEHVLEMRLSVTFWANPAQVNDCRRTAERVLLQTLYADANMALARLDHAVMEGSREQAFRWIGELRKIVNGESP